MVENLQLDFQPDNLATTLVDKWVKWDSARDQWKEDKQELRDYIFSTSTRTTTNSKLPWKNSTVTPKLTQIRDNLHANYMAALFPSEDWFMWDSGDRDETTDDKRRAITQFMKQKLKASDFQLLVSQLVYDYIDYGVVFASHAFVNDVVESTNGPVVRYSGPKAFRLSPLDVVFNPVAESFDKSPMLRRMLKSVGDLLVDMDTKPNLQYDKSVIDKCINLRKNYQADPEFKKNFSLEVDGFGSLDDYLNGDMVELIEFWGDVYDPTTQEVMRNRIITVVDRSYILRNVENPHWSGKKPVYYCGWRLRPDNLWAQGPLDQLVGMQYRVDHLENLKADVFDLIAFPVLKIKGNTVEDFEYYPGAEIFCGDEGDVEPLKIDATALQADMQIAELMNRMEELAGAPKQAMGIRTPGEKTKYEVQALENSAGRIFQSKVSWFERNILEPLLNGMLADALSNFSRVEKIKVKDEDLGVEEFVDVTKEDLMTNGKLYPVGARHFAEQAKFLQELQNTIVTVQQIPSVVPHISGKAIAKALEDNLGWDRYKIVQDNAFIFEQQETQRLMNTAQEDLAVEATIPVEDVNEPPIA